jgi:hypothetical protein
MTFVFIVSWYMTKYYVVMTIYCYDDYELSWTILKLVLSLLNILYELFWKLHNPNKLYIKNRPVPPSAPLPTPPDSTPAVARIGEPPESDSATRENPGEVVLRWALRCRGEGFSKN